MNLILFIIKIIHTMIFISAVSVPYLTDNKDILSLMIVYYVFTLTSWYLYDDCFLTPIENKLNKDAPEEKYTYSHNNKNKSFIAYDIQLFTSLSDAKIFLLLSIYPFINTLVCLYKINHYDINSLLLKFHKYIIKY